MIDPKYLPFDAQTLRQHFLGRRADRHVLYYEKSADAYQQFGSAYPDRVGLSLSALRKPCQIERDERFWTAGCLLAIFHGPNRAQRLEALLRKTFGDEPPLSDFASWSECLGEPGDLRLYLEPNLPSPRSYTTWLRSHPEYTFIPYRRDAAARSGSRLLEGTTHVDALVLNVATGFAVLVESKVLSDISDHVSFDARRNQLVRSIDVMLESSERSRPPLSHRRPMRSLLVLLTPELFRREPHTRLYGWLFREYRDDPSALGRDLPHRPEVDWHGVARRLGWLTWEECAAVAPGACAWLPPSGR